jgi:hypothetical protein
VWFDGTGKKGGHPKGNKTFQSENADFPLWRSARIEREFYLSATPKLGHRRTNFYQRALSKRPDPSLILRSFFLH